MVHEIILTSYGVLIRQLEVCLKPFIVPAILDHDEMSRGWKQKSTPEQQQQQHSPPEPKALVATLDNIYHKFKHFALDDSYIEQIIKQVSWEGLKGTLSAAR